MFSAVVNTSCSLSCFQSAATHTTTFCQNMQRNVRRVLRSLFKGASPPVKTEQLTSQTPRSYITCSVSPSLSRPASIFLTSLLALSASNSAPPSLLVLTSPPFVLVKRSRTGVFSALTSYSYFVLNLSCPAKYLLAAEKEAERASLLSHLLL